MSGQVEARLVDVLGYPIDPHVVRKPDSRRLKRAEPLSGSGRRVLRPANRRIRLHSACYTPSTRRMPTPISVSR